MGEFDLSLINEFRCHPSFYDRNSPRFKDKLYNAHLWQEMSNKLGFDVSILKDRILQLRNRYNLEKRRIEQLREEEPNKVFDSPWPLYDHLHFLSDHIRARRSYKKMMPLNGVMGLIGGGGGPYLAGPELSNSCSNNSNLTLRYVTDATSATTTADDRNQNVTAFPNGLLTVKLEDDSETEEETESQNNSEINAFDTSGLIPETHSTSLPVSEDLQQQQEQLYANKKIKTQWPQKIPFPPNISIRRLDSLRKNTADSSSSIYSAKQLQQYQQHQQQQQQRVQYTSAYNQSSQQNDDESTFSIPPAKQARLTARELKYKAFGNFISSSLLDLPPGAALELVQQFTSDIVSVLMKNAREVQEQQQQNDYSEN